VTHAPVIAHHQTGAEVSRQFGTSAEVSRAHFGTELSRRPANIFFATTGGLVRFNITRYNY